jgi:ankyrin repeat protein
MSQNDIDAFIDSARDGTLTSAGVGTALTSGIPVNGQHSRDGFTALDCAVRNSHYDLVVALLAAKADTNIHDASGRTSVWHAAVYSTAAIMQLVIDGGGIVNIADKDGSTPLIELTVTKCGDAAARLGVLLARPELKLDAKYRGWTAEQLAAVTGHGELKAAIAEERVRRRRSHTF